MTAADVLERRAEVVPGVPECSGMVPLFLGPGEFPPHSCPLTVTPIETRMVEP